MSKIGFIFLTLIFLVVGNSKAQPQRLIDSLQKKIKSQTDTSKAASMVRLSWELINIAEYDSALALLKAAKALSLKHDYQVAVGNTFYLTGIIEMYRSDYVKARKNFFESEKYYLRLNKKLNLTSVYNSVGVSYFREGDLNRSLEYYNKALKMNEELGKKSGIAAALTNIGSNYYIQGKIAEALDFNFRSLKIEKEIGNRKGESSSLITIGIIYQNLKETDKAIDFFNKSLKISREDNDRAGIANSIMNLGDAYFSVHKNVMPPKDSLKYNALVKTNNKIALENFTTCLRLFEELGDRASMSNALGGIGAVYGQEKEYKKALPFFLRALKNDEEINDLKGICVIANSIAETYLCLKEIDKAIDYCNLSLKHATEMRNIEAMQNAEKILSEAYVFKNNAALAVKHYKNYVAINDSVFDIEHKKNVTEIATKYETEIKDKENKELSLANTVQSLRLNQNRYLIFGLAALLLLCLTIAYIVIKQNKLKATQKSALLEQKLLRSQMNPHFIFNALTAIESFIYKNEPREAGKYLSGFARLMRLILENSREEYVTLEKEINTLEHYLNLQKLRYDNSFSYKINIDENIDVSSFIIPPMLAQPFIENSIEHGLKNLGRMGEITLNFYLKENELVFEARDNGIGFEKSMLVKNKESGHKSMATTITIERLKNLNRNKSKKIKWLAEDIKDQINNVLGTRVVFTIPFKEINVG